MSRSGSSSSRRWRRAVPSSRSEGGPGEIIDDGESGVLTSPDRLARALAGLYEDRDLAARIASNGRQRARTTFGASRGRSVRACGQAASLAETSDPP